LHKNGVHKFWHKDGYKYYLRELAKNDTKIRTYEEWFEALDDKGYALQFGDLGKIYSHQWRRFGSGLKVVNSHNVEFDKGVDQITNIIEDIKKNPYGRYKVVTAWNPGEIQSCALPPCHMLFQLNCRPIDTKERTEWAWNNGLKDEYKKAAGEKGKRTHEWEEWLDSKGVPGFYLDCALTVRSNDTFLGMPVNIASYALLTMIIAELAGAVPGELIYTANDVHIYENHIEQVRLQQARKPLKLPTVKLSSENWGCIDDVTFDDISLVEYESHPPIEGDLSVGV
jgi:thymidylate synthase